MVHLDELRQFLDRFFQIERYGDDQGGIYRASPHSIQRIGLALEPWPTMPQWVASTRIDALFLHRPWKLEPWHVPTHIGLLAYHLAFDERLTLGFNTRLADSLGMANVEVLGEKGGRPLGMIGDVAAQSFGACRTHVQHMFGGLEDARPCLAQVQRVAVVGGMNDMLVREAAARRADVYVTGQFRQPAEGAVVETGIGMLVVGHRRSEEWGLRALGGVLRERWASLAVHLPFA